MKRRKNADRPLLIAVAVCILAVVTMIIVLAIPQAPKMGTFTPPPFDAQVQTGVPTVPQELGWSELDAQAYKVSVCGVVQVTEDLADVWFTNPEGNTVWLKLRILDKNGNILGESGIVKPGEYVQSVQLTQVPASGTAITMKIMAYAPETYYSEGSVSLNTTITVK